MGEWYCGYVFPFTPPEKSGGLSIDDIAAMQRCGRWHPTREARESCDHGVSLDRLPVGADVTPTGSPVPIQTVPRTNRHEGACLWCGGSVPAEQGQLVDIDGVLRPVHREGECR